MSFQWEALKHDNNEHMAREMGKFAVVELLLEIKYTNEAIKNYLKGEGLWAKRLVRKIFE